MAHEVEKMLYVGQVPWHGLGTKFETAPSLEEAIKAAGLDWKVLKMPLKTVADGIEVPVVSLMRDTDKQFLGYAGPDWTPFQNEKAFEFFKPIIDSKQATIDTAGSLRKGVKVFVLAKINKDPMVIKGDDTVQQYVLLSNSHDGSTSVRIGFTPIRVVCANTLALAHSDSGSKLIRVPHTKNVEKNVQDIQETMNLASAAFEATAEQYRAMAGSEINTTDLNKFIKLVFKQKQMEINAKIVEAGGESTEEDVCKLIIPKITELFETGRGSDLLGAKGTLWGAYNAVTEYIQYNRGKEEATRLDQTWFGQGQVLNRRALKVAGDMLKAA